MLSLMMRLVGLPSNTWLLGAIVVGASLAAVPETSLAQEGTMDEDSLPRMAPWKELTVMGDGKGKMGYILSADHIELLEKIDVKAGVEVVVGPPQEWSIAPKFDQAHLFSEGAAAVEVSGRWGFIDEDGRFFVQPQFDEVHEFSAGYAEVCVEDQWGYINRRGEVVIPPQYEWADCFSEGLAAVSKGGKYGYINTLGAFVIPPQFDDAGMFAEGAAAVRRGAKSTYIRRDGKPLTDLLFDRAEVFLYGRAAVLSGNRWGVLDNLGNLIVPFQFEEISSQYSEGLAAAKRDGKWGFIDLRGEWVIQPIYDRANDFTNGLAVVFQNNMQTLCIIDPLGNVKSSRVRSAHPVRSKKSSDRKHL